MIDRTLLENHPVSRLAAEKLFELRETPIWTFRPLLDLALHYLDSLDSDDIQNSPWILELRDEAHKLATQPDQASVASLFIPNQGEFREQLREMNVPSGQEWPILKEHLDLLEMEMKAEPDADAVARLLAENLHNSLSHLSPNFARQVPSN